MTIYITIAILSILLCYLNRFSTSTKATNMQLLIILTCIFAFFAFRIGFTPDYYNYIIDYDSGISNRYDTIGEFGYLILINTIPTYRMLLVIQTLLFCACLYVAFRVKIAVEFWWIAFIMLFVYTGFLLGNMSGLRSCFVSIAFFIGLLIKDKSKTSFVTAVILLLAASTIHKSGLVMLPLLFLGNKPWSNRGYSIVIVIAIILCVISLLFANTLNVFVNSTVDYLGLDERFESYRQEEIRNVTRIGTFTILRLAMLFYLFFETMTIIKKGNANNLVFVKLTAVFFMLNLMPGIGLIVRFYYYLAIPAMIGATTVLYHEEIQSRRLLYLGALLLYGIWDQYLLTSTSYFADTFAHYDNILF